MSLFRPIFYFPFIFSMFTLRKISFLNEKNAALYIIFVFFSSAFAQEKQFTFPACSSYIDSFVQ